MGFVSVGLKFGGILVRLRFFWQADSAASLAGTGPDQVHVLKGSGRVQAREAR